MKEGDKLDWELRYYIPDFDRYDQDDDEERLKSRTLRVNTTSNMLRVEGYQQKPLAKYGKIRFQVVCDDVSADTVARLVVEAENQATTCPSIVVEIHPKKAMASASPRAYS